MVLTALADVSIDVSVWGVRKIYNISHWLIWGTQKTETDILIENQQKTIHLLQENIETMNKRLEYIEEEKKK